LAEVISSVGKSTTGPTALRVSLQPIHLRLTSLNLISHYCNTFSFAEIHYYIASPEATWVRRGSWLWLTGWSSFDSCHLLKIIKVGEKTADSGVRFVPPAGWPADGQQITGVSRCRRLSSRSTKIAFRKWGHWRAARGQKNSFQSPPDPLKIFFPSLLVHYINPHLTIIHSWISKLVYYVFTAMAIRDSKGVRLLTDSFMALEAQRQPHYSKCVFISAFLLSPRGTPAARHLFRISIPTGLPRNPRDTPRPPHFRAVSWTTCCSISTLSNVTSHNCCHFP